jgi:hypothetical protein
MSNHDLYSDFRFELFLAQLFSAWTTNEARRNRQLCKFFFAAAIRAVLHRFSGLRGVAGFCLHLGKAGCGLLEIGGEVCHFLHLPHLDHLVV